MNNNKLGNTANSSLEWTLLEMQREGNRTLERAIRFLQELPSCSPMPTNLLDPQAIPPELRSMAPEQGSPYEELLAFIMERVLPQSINVNHPGYMGFIPSSSVFPAALADFLAAVVNRQVAGWAGAPAAVRLETNVVEWIREIMGYPSTALGVLTSGGSMANFSAVAAARQHHLGEELVHGTVYVTDQVHHSIRKACQLARIPSSDLCVLPSDAQGRALPAAMEEAIQQDLRRGKRPFLLVASAGTTNCGAIDPLPELACLCKAYGLWLHVDAAYGGFFNLCEQGRSRLQGIEAADSITLDPHKSLYIPYGTGCLLVKEGEHLREAHTVSADYYQDYGTPDGEMSFNQYSLEGSRPFRGLAVWFAVKVFGMQAFRAALADKLELASWAYRSLSGTDRFECPVPPELSIVTFRYLPRNGNPDTFNSRLLQNVNKMGEIMLSSTRFQGKYILRMAILGFAPSENRSKRLFGSSSTKRAGWMTKADTSLTGDPPVADCRVHTITL